MKKFNVTVNGVTYEVEVEEVGAETVAPAAAPVAASAPKAAPTAAKPAAKAAPAGKSGSVVVKSPMPGNIMKVNFKVGDSVKKGDVLCVLEAMKMENEIFAAEGGTVKSIDAAQGSSVNSGDVIITLG